MAQAVEFHTGVADTLAFACRLLRKAYRHGATVLCLAPPARLDALDRALWTFVEREFVPHVRLAGTVENMLRRTPIWLASALPAAGAAREVVLNLGGDLPVAAAEAEGAEGRAREASRARVIEVIGADADEVERGRALWRQYKAAGFEVVHHPFKAARED
ncbi:MAG: DNA polymerase III subunit chi [Burkholderiales bacterium]|nr:DNA polymerase III subunit chi [Burkholderiales bacterium]